MGKGVAIVTGGASGIGRELSIAMAKRGYEVVVADLQAELAGDVAREIGSSARAAKLDVRDFPAFDALAKETVERSGRIDFLFNNAGIAVGGEMTRYEPEDWKDVIDVNLLGVGNGIQAVYKRMVAQGSGHIVNTASVAGLVPTPIGSYAGTKHGVIGITKALRLEARAHGVRASAICPGPIRTPIMTGGKFGRMRIPGLTADVAVAQWERLKPIDPDELVRRVLPQVFANKAIIIEPKIFRVAWALHRWAPDLSERLFVALYKKQNAETEKLLADAKARKAHTNGHTNGTDARSGAT